MKPYHENNGAAVYVGRAATLQILCFNIHATGEYINFDWSVTPTLSKLHCCLCRVKAKKANKNM